MIRKIELVAWVCIFIAVSFLTFTCGSESTPGSTGPSQSSDADSDSDSDADSDSDSDSDSDTDTHGGSDSDSDSDTGGGYLPPDFDISDVAGFDAGIDNIFDEIDIGAIDCSTLPPASVAACDSMVDSLGTVDNPLQDAIAQAQEAIAKGQATVQDLQDAVKCTQELQTKITQFNDAGVLQKLTLIGPLTAKITECTNKWNAIGK